MPIADRNLSPGTALVARYKGATHRAEVVATDDGLRFRLADGRKFRSVSSAASAVMDGKAVNGWRFWGVEDAVPDAAAEAATPPPPNSESNPLAKSATKKAKKRGEKPVGDAAAGSA